MTFFWLLFDLHLISQRSVKNWVLWDFQPSLYCVLSLAEQSIGIGPVYNRQALCVCGFVGLLPRWFEIACIDLHQTGSVGEGSDHLQLIKVWPSCVPGKGVCGMRKFWLRLTTASAQCMRLSKHIFMWLMNTRVLQQLYAVCCRQIEKLFSSSACLNASFLAQWVLFDIMLWILRETICCAIIYKLHIYFFNNGCGRTKSPSQEQSSTCCQCFATTTNAHKRNWLDSHGVGEVRVFRVSATPLHIAQMLRAGFVGDNWISSSKRWCTTSADDIATRINGRTHRMYVENILSHVVYRY